MEGTEIIVEVGITEDLPVDGYDILLANDLRGRVVEVLWKPVRGREGEMDVGVSSSASEAENGRRGQRSLKAEIAIITRTT